MLNEALFDTETEKESVLEKRGVVGVLLSTM